MEKTIRILIAGGIISPGDLEIIATAAQMHRGSAIAFGSRQEIYVSCPEEEITKLGKRLIRLGFCCEADPGPHANIVTSFASVDIYPSTIWVTGDTFFHVLEKFHYRPRLKINITDPVQRLIPLFTGHLNFIASHHRNYWFLYIHLPGFSRRELWPGLIYIDEIAPLAQRIEEICGEKGEEEITISQLFDRIGNETIPNSRSIDRELTLVKKSIPYYEGMNPVGNAYWLGIYRRDYQYSLSFILDLCELCRESKMGKISITTWKTMLIKDIHEADRIKWEVLLGKHGVNIRHSSLELHWHIPDLDTDALQLKNKLVNSFDQKDIRTYGICFSIHSEEKSEGFGNVLIERLDDQSMRYKVSHTPEFSLFDSDRVAVKVVIRVSALVKVLQEICLLYYKQLKEREAAAILPASPSATRKPVLRTFSLFQCQTCFTIYNQDIGDVVNNIMPGIPFESLPEHYLCPVCEGEKHEYIKLEEDL